MKKLIAIILCCVLILWPIKALAILQVDEDGKPIMKDTGEDEVTIMSTPEDSEMTDDTPVSSDENPGSVQADDISKKASDNAEDAYVNEDNNLIPTILLSGGSGIILGILGTYLVISRRK